MFHKDAFQHGKRGITGKSIRKNENDCNKIVHTNHKGKHLLYFLSLFLCSRKKQKNEYAYRQIICAVPYHTMREIICQKYHYL
jgi:hypothetical protein